VRDGADRPGEAEYAEVSFAQQRLWFLDQLVPDSPFYNVPVAYRVAGRLDVAALEQALIGLVARHESLRTTLPSVSGRPYQRIAPPGPVALPVIKVDGEEGARALVRAEAAAPFDLAEGPLLRARLARLDHEDHVLVLVAHHAVVDGWSLGVLREELSALYDAAVAGVPPPLAPLPIQYADYAAWQRDRLDGGAAEAQLAWWRSFALDLVVIGVATWHQAILRGSAVAVVTDAVPTQLGRSWPRTKPD
jgi:hypothetical protein